ncbi:hypothetical protein [Ralstonia phage phiRSL1]|uniref:Uncharacterized protein n=1 Tax=Ralstonia phage phiRSL1 TaxID=1980924 RepID=B2ZXY3_9CAUD|nr:hypothetical protein RSL1_ORF114 [Ralstonia phage phiRSL1]BAG41559.1 hypothetical protein [Ralstonia phage phiRSL1]
MWDRCTKILTSNTDTMGMHHTTALKMQNWQERTSVAGAKEWAWIQIKEAMAAHKFPEACRTLWADSSVTVFINARRSVKITVRGEVFIEQRLNSFEFKSEKQKPPHFEEALALFTSLLPIAKTAS